MPQGSRSVQRLLFPQPGDEAAHELYVRAESDAVSWDRFSLTVAPGATASLATYFGAFPAGYWNAHTDIERITVVGEFDGAAIVRVCAADEEDGRRVLATVPADGAFSWDIRIGDGAWFWLEVEAGSEGTTFRDGAWLAPDAKTATATVCITTHNRGIDCVGVLERLAADGLVREQLVRVIVVDQGDRPVREVPGFDRAAAALEGRLKLIEQRNLGGSGGFSRGMVESLQERADHALLLDDDVLLEPDSVLRMLAFAARTTRETIVGAHMLSLLERTVLHSVGERVDRRGFWWTSVEPALAPVDLAVATIESTPGLRRLHDVDFNGWWMCLVPLGLVRRVGASLPLFIKWDDAEFGLRAAAAGVPTVTLPGAALWHMPWTGKDDGLDWQAYFQLRNRLVVALVHSASARGGGVLSASFAQDVNHLLCMQYGSAAARRVALRDVLDGPAHLPRTIQRRTTDMRVLMARAGQSVVPEAQLPAERGGPVPAAPAGRVEAVRRLLRVAVHQFRRSRAANVSLVDAALPRAEGKWWVLGLLDSATVASATGTGAFVARRDRRVASRLLWDAVGLRARLWVRWPRLARTYRAAVAELASPAAWHDLFDGPVDGRGGRTP
ncbi:glycosyltransferase [Microbacterium sp. LMI12-1-1.1]|uniref:glycosyltransferase n=1 Tax=Microbacterium sp. LMI12-1-1.1 TaxID=3135225 RepID=UPI0034155F3D